MDRNPQFIKFLISGTISTLINLFVRFCLSFFISYPAAIIISYLIGMMTSYIIFKMWVFQSQRHNLLQQLGYYLVINLLGLAQTIFVSLWLFHYIFTGINGIILRETLSHIIGLSVPIVSSYIGHKYLTFR
jgi:putative flippase GtrA